MVVAVLVAVDDVVLMLVVVVLENDSFEFVFCLWSVCCWNFFLHKRRFWD